MPFQSTAQRAWMFANKPEMAKKWQAHTPKGKKLPRRKSVANLAHWWNKKKGVLNAKRKKSKNPMKYDPSRTGLLRRKFAAQLAKRFRKLKMAIVKLVVDEDAFGLTKKKPMTPATLIDNARTQFPAAWDRWTWDKRNLWIDLRMEEAVWWPAANTFNPGQERDEHGRWSGGGAEGVGEKYKTPEEREARIRSLIPPHLAQGVKGALQHGPVDEEVLLDMLSIHGPKMDRGDADLLLRRMRYVGDLQEVSRDKRVWYRLPGQEGMKLNRTSAARLAVNTFGLVANRFEFLSSPDQLRSFQEWLRQQFQQNITGLSDQQLWARYIQEGFQKGAARTFDDVKASRWGAGEGDFYAGSKMQFLADSFRQPEALEKVQLLASRTFTDLVNVTESMVAGISRTLVDGLTQGQNPRDIARQMAKDVDDIGIKRATLIARTEIIRAHASGQLLAMKNLGMKEVGVMVEWSTAGDERVCEECEVMDGAVFSIDEAEGLIPRHPNCRCFVDGDTPVWVFGHWRAIQHVQVGDEVLTHKGRFKKVTQIHRHEATECLVVKLFISLDRADWRPLEVTGEHPVLTPSGWKEAKDINEGDFVTMLRETNGKLHTNWRVFTVEHRIEQRAMLWNLSVEEDESFTVAVYNGQGSVWAQGGYIVHNCAFIPANVGEDEDDQIRGKGPLDRAIADSLEAGGEDEEDSDWMGADVEVGKVRPKSIFNR